MEMTHTLDDLKALQSLPLSTKIGITQTRITEWYMRYGGQVSVSFSGGKDSTVLLDLARRVYPDIEAVYVDTGLEYPEVTEFVKTVSNVTVLKSQFCKVCTNCAEGCFPKVIRQYGWCYPGKETAMIISRARNGGQWAHNYLNGVNRDGTPSRFRQSRYAKWKVIGNVFDNLELLYEEVTL